MASFKSLKEKLKNPLYEKESKISEPKTIDNPKLNQLDLEECRYLMNLIASSNFKGTDVQILYNIVLKLQTTIKSILNPNG